MSHEESLLFGRRLGRLIYRPYNLVSALFMRDFNPPRIVRMAFGPKLSRRDCRKIAKKSFEHFGMTLAEALNCGNWSDEKFREIIAVEGLENAEIAASSRKGIICVSAHYGNWEILGPYAATLFGRDLAVVMRNQPLPKFNDMLRTMRSRRVRRLVSIDDGSFGALMRLVLLLKRNEHIGMLNDHYSGRRGMPVSFFGRKAMTSPGAAFLSIVTGAPLLPLFIVRKTQDPAKHILQFHPPIFPDSSLDMKEDILRMLGEYRRLVEERIRLDPSQYLWTYVPWSNYFDAPRFSSRR